MDEKLTVGARIWEAAENKGFTKVDFSKKMRIVRQTLNNWINGESSPDQEELERAAKLLGVEVIQLLGIIDGSPERTEMIPFFDAVAVGGFGIIADQSPVKKPVRMVNPGTFFRNAEGALQITGHSMFPKYPSGCIVAYKIASQTLILWGEDYVIELATDRRLILKRIEKSELKDHVKAVSYNVNKDNKYVYDPIDIPRNEISRIFMVLGKIELEAMQS